MIQSIVCWLMSTLIASGTVNAAADNPAALDAASLEFFEKDVRPILTARCYKCHSEEGKKKGGLLLDSMHGWKTGGDTGPALVAGEPDKSLLIEAIRYDNNDMQMPPKGKLPAKEIEVLEKWVKMGAPDPRVKATVKTGPREVDIEKGRAFWSFRPIANPEPPKVPGDDWSRSDADRFILAKLATNKLDPSRDAPREVLIRRAYFDLIGLPPTPEQIDAFVNDTSANAFEKVVDQLLASTHFGERWGRHWLDISRFAESSGGGRTLIFRNAWRFRDYVIQSFNDDKPYDQFVREQIAGDLLPYETAKQRAEQLTGSGYLMLGANNYELQDKELLRMEVIDEQINTMGRTFLGLTLGCARCHDHKFDPIPTKDYYALAGIFRSTKSVLPGNVSQFVETELPLPPDQLAVRKKVQADIASLQEKIELAKADVGKQQALLAKLTGKPIKTLASSKQSTGSKSVSKASLAGIVVDDVSATLEGPWTRSVSNPRYVDEGYRHAPGGSDSKATFVATLPAPGEYEVRVAYSSGSNRSSRTAFEVQYANGSETKTIDQRPAPRVDRLLMSLGTYAFGAQGRVVIDAKKASGGVVIIDAVQFLPVGDALKSNDVAATKSEAKTTQKKTGKTWPGLPDDVKPLAGQPFTQVTASQVDRPAMLRFIVRDASKLPGIVLDQADAKLVGNWQQSVHTPPFVGDGYIHDGNEGKGQKSATFSPAITQAGVYEVRIGHNANSSRSTKVPVTIRHADGETRVSINQHNLAPVGALFRPVGRFRFAAGNKGSVTISNEGTTDGHVIVDSVWLVPVELIGKTVEAAPKWPSLPRLFAADLKREAVISPNKQVAITQLTLEIKGAMRDIAKLEAALKAAQKKLPAGAKVMSVLDHTEIGDYHVCIRGSAHNLGDKVPRGFVQVLSPKGVSARPTIPEKQSGRLQLADWLASPRNPLTARVMVNRIWVHLMGRGIVPTPDNFGSPGDLPTHPQLLDHLATQFIADGWSVKQTIRRIMLSRVYQMSSVATANPKSETQNPKSFDPENRLYHRANRKRLDAEVIRDNMLAIAGKIDMTPGGPAMRSGTGSELGYKFSSVRRSVYVPVFRNTLDPIFEVFDFANPNVVTGHRKASTLPTQALYMMNSPFVQEQARAAAARILEQEFPTEASRLIYLHRQVLGRRPSPREVELAMQFLATFNPNEQKDRARQSVDAWTGLVHNLFASLDFRYQN